MQLATACDGWTSRRSVTMLCERIAHPACWSHVARLGNRMGPAGGARPDLSKTTDTHDPGGFASTQRLARPGPKCRVPTALLLPAVAVAVAGGGEGRLPRTRRCGGGVRPVRALAVAEDASALGDRPARVREAGQIARLHALQR